MEVNGAVVLITGASSGIGAAAARAFDRAGATVVLAARRRERLEAVAKGMRSALVLPTDLAERGAAQAMVEAAIARFGRLDVLINNAAAITAGRSDELDAAALRAALQTNFLAALEATQTAVAQMRKQGGGQIINVGSPGAFFGLPLMAAYAASKGALSGWTRSMQVEWAGSGIAVTEYLPGRVDTGSPVHSALGALGPEVFDDPQQSPLARLLMRPQRPDEVGEHLVDCVRRPRPVAYSGLGARVVAVLTAFPGLSQRLAGGLARVVRDRLGSGMFAALPEAAPSPHPRLAVAPAATGREVKPSAAPPAAPKTTPAAAPSAAPPAAPSAPPPPKPLEMPAQEAKSAGAAKKTASAAKKKAVKKKAAKKKAAAVKPRTAAARKQPDEAAAVKPRATARKPPRGLAAGDEAARELSPIMSERVRAAAEKAAASARGGKAAAKPAGGGTGNGGGNGGES